MEVRKEFPKYFDAIGQHPRLLVGQKVPRLNGEGEETLRDASDAKEWQDAVKDLLMREVQARAGTAAESLAGSMATLHQSIELFQGNPDLVPGTRTFDYELAERFATLVKPYEVRVDGKLRGYSIPVQPLVAQLRSNLTAERAKRQAPAAPVAPVVRGAAPKPPAPPAEAPQAGIPSKAGASSQAEDFSVLFGTLGLKDFRI